MALGTSQSWTSRCDSRAHLMLLSRLEVGMATSDASYGSEKSMATASALPGAFDEERG